MTLRAMLTSLVLSIFLTAAAAPAQEQPDMIPTELAISLMSWTEMPGYGEPTFLIGEAPPDFEFPWPDDMRILGTAFVSEDRFSIVAVVEGPKAKVEAEIREALQSQGWQLPPARPMGGGFQFSGRAPTSVFCQPDGTLRSIRAIERSMGGTRLVVGQHAPGSQVHTACNPLPERAPMPVQTDVLPALLPPGWARSEDSISGIRGGADPWSVESTSWIRTDRGMEALQGHFGEQLKSAGWIRVAETGSESVHATFWRFEHEGSPWHGEFLVLDLPEEGMYFLRVTAFAPKVRD